MNSLASEDLNLISSDFRTELVPRSKVTLLVTLCMNMKFLTISLLRRSISINFLKQYSEKHSHNHAQLTTWWRMGVRNFLIGSGLPTILQFKENLSKNHENFSGLPIKKLDNLFSSFSKSVSHSSWMINVSKHEHSAKYCIFSVIKLSLQTLVEVS